MKSISVLLLLLCSSHVLSQIPENIQRYRSDLKGNITARTKGLLDGNRVRTVFFNNGSVSDWFTGVNRGPHLEWPKGTGYRNADGFSLFVGAKAKTIDTSGKEYIFTPIETGYREEMDRDPINGTIWGFEPIAGYVNPAVQAIAISSDPNTWPATWPAALGLPAEYNGDWYSHFGKGVNDCVVEAFYVMDDSKDGEFMRSPYNYYPITSDSLWGGLGLRAEVRTFQFRHQELQDILFWNYNITNASDSDYDTSMVGFFCDPSVGSVNNLTDIDKEVQLIYLWSLTGTGIPDNYTTGYFGINVLPSTDDSLAITAFTVSWLNDKGPGGMWPKNDGSVWNTLMRGVNDTALVNSNLMTWCGTGPFSFPKWSTQTYSLAMLFGSSLDALIKKQVFAEVVHENGFVVPGDIAGLGNIIVDLELVDEQSVVSGTTTIKWKVTGVVGNVRTYVYASNELEDWLIGIDSTGSSSLEWNTQQMTDGILYTISATTYANSGVGFDVVRNITINNAVPALPEALIDWAIQKKTLSGVAPLTLFAGDADGDSCTVRFQYTTASMADWKPITEWFGVLRSAKKHIIQLDTKNIPNNYRDETLLQCFVAAGNDTAVSNIVPVVISNTVQSYGLDSLLTVRSGNATGAIEVLSYKAPDIPAHTYRLTFFSPQVNTLTANLVDNNSGDVKFDSFLMNPGISESPMFDDIRLKILNDTLVVNQSQTKWNNQSQTFPMFVRFDDSNPSRNGKYPYDYEITFSNVPLDTAAIASGLYKKIPVPFKIKNTTLDSFSKFLHMDVDNSNTLSAGDTIRILEQFVSTSNFKIVTKFAYGSSGSAAPQPGAGDIFVIKTKKPFSTADTIIFSTDKITPVEDNDVHPPDYFSLSQNYPNPFNPVTTIRFTLPSSHHAVLKIFDILGKEIATLVDEQLPQGMHAVPVRAGHLPSGMYFYRLQAGNYSMSKKMILLK